MDFKDLEKNLDVWQKNLVRRGADVDLNKVVADYDGYLKLLSEVEKLRTKRKAAASKKDITLGKTIKKELDTKEKNLMNIKLSLDKVSFSIPNLLLKDVPDGGEDDSQVLAIVGKPAKIDNPKDHIELGTSLNILDIGRGVKTSGSRFYFLKNQAVELEFALVRWVFDLLKKKGFELLVSPAMVSERVMSVGGYLGKAADEVYKTQDDLYLVGTSEQSMLGYHVDEIVDVPKRYAAFSTCFRREAGSYGKDVKGIIRTHQFDKVEMFSYVDPKKSGKELDELVDIQEEILKGLEIPYQKIILAARDTSSFASAKTVDLESWLPSQKRYRETHSASNCTDWQARRANIRYKKGEYVHTLNGTAVAIGRTLVALIENHQQPDGSIKIPKVLHPYLSFTEIK